MKERDCANCKHHTSDGCSKWDCEFEAIDLISRADAIEAVKFLPPYREYWKGTRKVLYTKEDIIKGLKALPSADTVSREVYDTIEPNKIYCSPQLAHNVEVVVRCKDCMHRHECECPMYHEEWFTIDEGDGYVDDDYNVIDKTVDDGFCQYGERREP